MADETPSPADLIAQMNREFTETKEDPTNKPPPAAATPPPTTPPATPPAASTPPATPPSTTPPGTPPASKTDDYIPPDPSFVRKPTEPASPPVEGQPPVEGTQPPPLATPPPPVPDALFYSRLSELTDGHLKEEKDFVQFVTQYNELVDQQQKGFQPQFPSARAKMAYELLQKNPGQELETTQRTLRALSVDVEKKDPKELLFEAFLLDPLNIKAVKSEGEARKFFEADYGQRFNDLENNLHQQLVLQRETEQAKETIAKIQTEWTAANAPAEQQSKDVERYVAQAADNFGGVRLFFTEKPGETDFLNIPVSDPTELERLKFNALNPDKWHAEFANQFQTQTGYDWAGYLQARYEMENHVEIRQKAYDHGFKLGQAAKVQEHRNSTPPADIGKQAQTPPAPKPAAKSMLHAWEEAIK